MLHLRVIVPPGCCSHVSQLLTASEAVTNVVVLPGAARQPPGDLVLADVAREQASAVVEALQALGIERDGSIALEQIDVSLSDRARRTEERAPGSGADAVVWEEVEERTSEESTLSWTFLAFLVLATVIAVIGVVTDQPILIVGAMVVGPEFGPLAGLCVSIVQRRRDTAIRSLLALAVGFPVAIAVAALVSRIAVGLGLFTAAMFYGPRPLTGFIFQPNLLSVIVALVAGVAGMLSLTSSKSAPLMGVLISVTTVPAAGNMAVALVFADAGQLRGSAIQLAVNLVSLVLAGTLTLLSQKLLSGRAR